MRPKDMLEDVDIRYVNIAYTIHINTADLCTIHTTERADKCRFCKED